MKAFTAFSALSFVVWSAAASGQDAVTVDPGHYKILFENAGVRLLKVTYGPGEKSKMHQHPDSVVVALSDAKVQFTLPDGKTVDNPLTNESAQYAPPGTHSPANVGSAPVDAVLVEFKPAKPGTATLPKARPDMAMKVLAEGPRGMAYRVTADASFQEPAGSKHDYDQIVVALGPAQMSLALEGKPPKTTWARGDAVFIGRGVPHESKNMSGKPVDFIIVAVR